MVNQEKHVALLRCAVFRDKSPALLAREPAL